MGRHNQVTPHPARSVRHPLPKGEGFVSDFGLRTRNEPRMMASTQSKIQNRKPKIAGTLIFLTTGLASVAFMVGLKPAPTSAGSARALASDSAAIRFEDITQKAGINFTHYTGAFGKKYLPETMGPGCAFIDYDNDGYPDILLINGKDFPGHKTRRATPKLYHNNGNGTFTDVTAKAGLDIEIYGMGVAVGDYDNDGWDDIYITGLGEAHLYHNEHN